MVKKKYSNMYLCDFSHFILATKHRTREKVLIWNLIGILKNCPLKDYSFNFAGGAKDIEKLRSAQLLVVVGKAMQSANLLKDNVFIDINIDMQRSDG